MTVEPQIQYVTTSDGVSIAYFDVGRGAPLVWLPNIPWSDVRSEFSSPTYNDFYPRLASEHRLIRYDVRGAGLSQRGVVDFSLAALQLDLNAVINRLAVDRVSLYAEFNSSPVALAYAAAYPRRVDRMILWGGFARGSDFWALPRLKAVQSLFEQDWDLYTETIANVIFGFASGEPARWYAAYMRDCVNQDEAGAHFAAGLRMDVTHLLPSISTPTLLLQPSDAAMAPMAWGRELGASIPGAQLKVLKTSVLWSDEIGEWIIASIRDFLAVMPQVSRGQTSDGRFQTILFTDIVGSTPLMHALGDAAWRKMLSEHERLIREILARHGGAEIKTIGDSFMASFDSASRTVECAIELQRAFAARNAHEPETSLHVRIGVNAGEPVADSDDLFGTAVTLASRIMGQAQGGEILVSDVVRQLVASRNFVFADRGKTLLKGFEDAVRLYEVSWQE